MKSYVTDTQLRLVGKGWEIREKLRRLSGSAAGERAELATLLPQLIGSGALGKEQPAPPRIPTQKKADRRVIPFPSS